MDNKEFNKLLSLWKKEKSMDFKGTVPQKSKDCLYFTGLEEYAKNGGEALESAKKQHIQSCAYCQKIVATFKETLREKEQTIPIYERLTQALSALANTLALPFRAMPRFTPALVPVLAVIIIFAVFSNRPSELINYSFEFTRPIVKTRGITGTPAEENKFRMSNVIVSFDCYAYLFVINEDEINLLVQEKIKGKVANTISSGKRLMEKNKLALLLTKKPIKDTSSAGEIIIKNYTFGDKIIAEALRKQLKRNDLSFYKITAF